MAEEWDTTAPLEEVTTQIQIGAQFAKAANQPISEGHQIRMGLLIIKVSGVLPEALREWNNLPTAQRTDWKKFKKHFHKADKYRSEQDTSSTAGYQTANAATAATEINNKKFKQMESTIANLRNELRQTKSSASHNQKPPPANNTSNLSYCWTHGSLLNKLHNSTTCKSKAPEHQDAATMENKMGGSENTYFANKENNYRNRNKA